MLRPSTCSKIAFLGVIGIPSAAAWLAGLHSGIAFASGQSSSPGVLRKAPLSFADWQPTDSLVPFVPHQRTLQSGSVNLNRYTPGETALGWTDSGQSLLFTHQSLYVAGFDDFDVDCSTTGIYALDLRSGRITRRAPAPREKNGSSEGNRRTGRPMTCGPFTGPTIEDVSLEPGGASVLYVDPAPDSDAWVVYRFDLRNGQRTRLGPSCSLGGISRPQASPDGRTIVAARLCGENRKDSILLMRSDGTGAHAIVPADTLGPISFTWSPDGTQLAYDDVRRGRKTVVVDTSGANRRVVGNGRSPSWSPDGQWIAYVGDDSIPEIHVVRPSGVDDRVLPVSRLHDETDCTPGGPLVWSPDGMYLVFSRSLCRGGSTLWRVRVADGMATQLTSADGHGSR